MFLPLAFMVSDEKSATFQKNSPIVIAIFWWLSIIFFLLVFSFLIFNKNVPWHGFIWVYPVCSSLSFLNLYVYVSCPVWEVFRHHFLVLFQSFPYSPFVLESSDMNFWCTHTDLWVFFFKIYFLFVVNLSNMYCSILQFTDSFLCPFFSAVDSSAELFISAFMFFSSKISIWVLFICSVSLWRLFICWSFLFFHLLKVCL